MVLISNLLSFELYSELKLFDTYLTWKSTNHW